MLEIKDLFGNVEPLDGWADLNRKRKVNGERTIRFLIFPTDKNFHGFKMVETESQLTFDGESYVIKKVVKKSIGSTYFKEVTAIHKFYVDMINKQQPKIHNGSLTFVNSLNMIFEDMPYTYVVTGSFSARTFENFGNDNRLSLLQKILERYRVEMEVRGSVVYFRKIVGNDTDFQFRYKHNIINLNNDDDSMDLATVISGTGAEGISAYYRSPNADIFGELDAPPVEDERFTSQATLLEEMKARLQDAPVITITINFADLRASGYPYTVPNEGDRIFIIYEPMDDFQLETRILEIDETFKENPNPNENPIAVKTDVVLSNHKKSFAGTTFDQIQKSLSKIVNDDGTIKYDFLDEAVKQATEALKSAQTELEFSNGIIAREKSNPNKLVLFNSAGIGISTNGGNTFNTAMTADGFVADYIAAGTLRGIIIEGVEIKGSRIISESSGTKTEISGGNFYSTGSFDRTFGNRKATYKAYIDSYNGALRARIVDKLVDGKKVNSQERWIAFTDKTVTTQREIHSGSIDYNGSRFIDFFADEILDGDVAGLSMHIYSAQNLKIEAGYDLNILLSDDFMADLTGGGFRVNSDGTSLVLKRNSPFTSSSGQMIQLQAFDTAVHGVIGIPNNNYNMHLRTMYGDYVILGARNEIHAKDQNGNNFVPVRATSFPTSSSVRYKENIEIYEDDVISALKDVNIYRYHLTTNLESGIYDKPKIGMIAEATLPIFRDEDGVDPYSITSFLYKVCQVQQEAIEHLSDRISDLELII